MENKEILNIDENYKSFHEFITQNRETIYRKLLNEYKEILENPESIKTLRVNGLINDISFGADFTISTHDEKSINERFNNVIFPFFENIEDYDTCAEAKIIYNKLMDLNN